MVHSPRALRTHIHGSKTGGPEVPLLIVSRQEVAQI